MPTYEYVCENCGYAFEKFQTITAGVLRKCPECGKMKLKRLIGTGGGIIFKGSGFYETDYRSESYKQGETAAKSKSSAAGSSSSNDTKAATETAKKDTPSKAEKPAKSADKKSKSA